MSLRENKAESPDWLTMLMFGALAIFGWLMIIAVDYREDAFELLDMSSQHGKQLIWIGSSVVIAALILLLDYRFITALSYPYYIGMLLLLMATLVLAPEVKGARSWFMLGPFTLQPSEFAKAATALAIARYCTGNNISLRQWGPRFISLGLILLPAGLIILQGDTGSAIVFMGLMIVLFREGYPVTLPLIGLYTAALFLLTVKFGPLPIVIALGGLAALLIGAAARQWKANRQRILGIVAITLASITFSFFVVDTVFNKVLKPHHQTRLNVLLGKEYSAGADYNVLQSKITIGAGGWTGKGYLKGTLTKGDFVPEQSTDFIFSTVGEEFGFIGSALLVLFFILLLLRILFIAERQRSHFTRVYGYGVAAILFVHFAVNIGMAIGLLPVVGIPLPFISYGGSSLWGFTILIFLLLKLDANRKLVLR